MWRDIRKFIIPVLAVLALWHFGVLARIKSTFQSTTDTLASVTTIEVGQDTKRELLQSNLKRAIHEYRATIGAEPTDLHSLVAAGLLQHADLQDEWHRPLVIDNGKPFVVRSIGRDALPGTEDDWTTGR
jgi:hypothetical protein